MSLIITRPDSSNLAHNPALQIISAEIQAGHGGVGWWPACCEDWQTRICRREILSPHPI